MHTKMLWVCFHRPKTRVYTKSSNKTMVLTPTGISLGQWSVIACLERALSWSPNKQLLLDRKITNKLQSQSRQHLTMPMFDAKRNDFIGWGKCWQLSHLESHINQSNQSNSFTRTYYVSTSDKINIIVFIDEPTSNLTNCLIIVSNFIGNTNIGEIFFHITIKFKCFNKNQ